MPHTISWAKTTRPRTGLDKRCKAWPKSKFFLSTLCIYNTFATPHLYKPKLVKWALDELVDIVSGIWCCRLLLIQEKTTLISPNNMNLSKCIQPDVVEVIYTLKSSQDVMWVKANKCINGIQSLLTTILSNGAFHVPKPRRILHHLDRGFRWDQKSKYLFQWLHLLEEDSLAILDSGEVVYFRLHSKSSLKALALEFDPHDIESALLDFKTKLWYLETNIKMYLIWSNGCRFKILTRSNFFATWKSCLICISLWHKKCFISPVKIII